MAKIDTTIEAVGNAIPNPFSDQPVDDGPSNTQRHGSTPTLTFELASC